MSKRIVTHRLSLNVANQALQATITLGFGDLATHRLVVDLRHGADVLELPPGSYAIAVQNEQADVDVLDSVTVYGPDGVYPNCIVYDVTTAVTGVEGVHEARFLISYVDETGAQMTLASPKIAFVVKEGILKSSDVMLSEPYSAVVKAAEKAENAAKEAAGEVQRDLNEFKESAAQDHADIWGELTKHSEQLSELESEIENGSGSGSTGGGDPTEAINAHNMDLGAHPTLFHYNTLAALLGFANASSAGLMSAKQAGKLDTHDSDIEDLKAALEGKLAASDLTEKMITDLLQIASAAQDGLMSAKQAASLAALVALFGEDGSGGEDKLAQIENILKAFEEYPDGDEITGMLAGKLDLSHDEDPNAHENRFATKVDKVGTASRLYGTDASGAQAVLAYNTGNEKNTVPYRDANGQFMIGVPSDAAHPARLQELNALKAALEQRFASFEADIGGTYFANALTGRASGRIATMRDVSPVGHRVRLTLKGKNLFPRVTAQTVSGVTVTVDADGTVHLNGTCTASANITLTTMLAETGIYYLCDFAEGDFPDNVYARSQCYVPSTGASLTVRNRTESGTSLGQTLPGGVTVECRIRLEGGHTYNDCALRPTLFYAEAPAAYVPYTTVAEVRTCGKNLLTYPYSQTTHTTNGITFTDHGDGTITANGTATAQATFYLAKDAEGYRYEHLIEDASFTLSGCPAGGSDTTYRLIVQRAPGYDFQLVDTGAGSTKKLPSSAGSTWYAAIIISSGTTVKDLTFKPMLEVGESATEYEAYKAGETVTLALGEGTVTSVSPSMTVLTTTEGVTLTAAYNRDANKVIEELVKAIVALGGKVGENEIDNMTVCPRCGTVYDTSVNGECPVCLDTYVRCQYCDAWVEEEHTHIESGECSAEGFTVTCDRCGTVYDTRLVLDDECPTCRGYLVQCSKCGEWFEDEDELAEHEATCVVAGEVMQTFEFPLTDASVQGVSLKAGATYTLGVTPFVAVYVGAYDGEEPIYGAPEGTYYDAEGNAFTVWHEDISWFVSPPDSDAHYAITLYTGDVSSGGGTEDDSIYLYLCGAPDEEEAATEESCSDAVYAILYGDDCQILVASTDIGDEEIDLAAEIQDPDNAHLSVKTISPYYAFDVGAYYGSSLYVCHRGGNYTIYLDGKAMEHNVWYEITKSAYITAE